MYLFEWGYQWVRRNSGTYEEAIANAAKVQRKPGQEVLETPDSVYESVSHRFFDNDSLYAFNDACIDVRTPNDEKRGLIALVTLGAGGILVWMFVMMTRLVVGDLLAGSHDEHPLPWDFYVFALPLPFVGLGSLYVFHKYVGPYMRLELFTARRIIVRFNRCFVFPHNKGSLRGRPPVAVERPPAARAIRLS